MTCVADSVSGMNGRRRTLPTLLQRICHACTDASNLSYSAIVKLPVRTSRAMPPLCGAMPQVASHMPCITDHLCFPRPCLSLLSWSVKVTPAINV